MPDPTAHTETLAEVLADGLAHHALARPYGESTAWCVCLRWSTERTEHGEVEQRAYEVHVAADLAARIEQAHAGEQHTRSSTEGHGPDYCAECSEAAQEWVAWPCSREALVAAVRSRERMYAGAERAVEGVETVEWVETVEDARDDVSAEAVAADRLHDDRMPRWVA